MGGVSSRAVDGNTDNEFSHGGCMMTNNEVNAWWRVDLETSHVVQTVRITTRNYWYSDGEYSVDAHLSHVAFCI